MAAAAIAIVPILIMPETARLSIQHPTNIPGTDKYVSAGEPVGAGAGESPTDGEKTSG
jgi:MHS family proline/betaine transporter-like MFS transporter